MNSLKTGHFILLIKIILSPVFIFYLNSSVTGEVNYNLRIEPDPINTAAVDINDDNFPDFVTISDEGKIIMIDGKTLKIVWDYSSKQKIRKIFDNLY